MKRLNREINIFSLSALDLFASVMGAFILLTVVLFPYYLKNADIVEKTFTLRQELKQIQTTLANTQQQLQECQVQKTNLSAQLSALQQEVKNCQRKLRHTFLAIVIKWATNRQDIDLHVIDPDGNEFYFRQHNRDRSQFHHSNAELSVDTTNGPGIEIWEEPRAKLGHYKIYANLYAHHDNPETPIVKSTVYYRDGSKKLRDITLTQKGQKELIATIEININGEVSILANIN